MLLLLAVVTGALGLESSGRWQAMRDGVKPVFGHKNDFLLLVLEVASQELPWVRASQRRTLFTHETCTPAGFHHVVAN